MEPISAQTRPSRRRLIVTLAVLTAALIAIALFVESPPLSALGKADLVGFGICHRIPERSFFLDGRQMPLCARCTGTFLGAMLGVAAFIVRRRGRASSLPPAGVLLVLLAFMGLWAADGLNSYLGFFSESLQVYEPRNWLRLATGTLNGLALSAFVLPVLVFTLWRDADPQPVIKNTWELLAVLPLAGLLIWVVQAEIDWLLYPLALLSSGGVLVLLTSVNAMLAAVALRLEGRAQTVWQALVPLTTGLALALVEITLLGLFRTYLATEFGLVIAEPLL